MLTYNQILKRIKTTCLSHQQVKNFYKGKLTGFLTDKTTLYTSVFLENEGGSININNKIRTSKFKLWILDLVNVIDNTDVNLDDVQSDCLSIAIDLISMLDSYAYQDWSLESDNNYELVQEKFNDMVAGVFVDITIRTPYDSDKCSIPVN